MGSGLRFFDSRSMRGPLWYHERESRRIEGLTVSKPGEIEARLGYVYAASGWRAMAQEKLNEITRRASQNSGGTPTAFIVAGLGEKERVFKLLYEAAEHRDTQGRFIRSIRCLTVCAPIPAMMICCDV